MLPIYTLKISPVSWNVVSLATIYLTFFADKCLTMKLMKDIHVYALHHAEFKKKCTGLLLLRYTL